MVGRVAGGAETAARLEGPGAQEAALAVVPLEDLAAGAQRRSEEGGLGYSDALVRELLSWFKRDFFSWADGAWCGDCGREAKVPLGPRAPLAEERRHLASRVEAFRCEGCGQERRFPRYNDPQKLLETRRGRCGEWANCFCLLLRALGYEARWCLDFTDHVWAELWSGDQGRWVHLDPCEDSWDEPLLYEQGWGKKLSYVLGFSRFGVQDVTRRYTEHYGEVLGRRTLCPESVLAEMLRGSTAAVRWTHDPATASLWEGRDAEERAVLLGGPKRAGTGSGVGVAEADGDLPGRKSGSVQWRAARKELGGEKNEDGGHAEVKGRGMQGDSEGRRAACGGGNSKGSDTSAESAEGARESFQRLLLEEFTRLTMDPEMKKDPNAAAAKALQNIQEKIASNEARGKE